MIESRNWLFGLSMSACQPMNTYVVEPGFEGPVVVVWEDPTGVSIGPNRNVPVPRTGLAFVREPAVLPVNIRFVEKGPSMTPAADHDVENFIRDGDCKGMPGPRVTYDSFWIGAKDPKARGALQALRQKALVATMRHRGHRAVADCLATTPTPFF
jgi:hypothetical protein